ncbi:MAG: DNA translocase FtsK 4TM domain-containing protein [Desulfobulbaceae bacterium]|nr:DNA translocase FtsK 4TM domain-containing protein [Desulfobulbaceae bacterium]
MEKNIEINSMPLPRKKDSGLRLEIFALFILFLAVFLLLCLVSYARPLLADQPVQQEPSQNWCGSLGYYIAYSLFSFFGLTSFLPVLVLIYISVTVFLPGTREYRLPLVVAGISGLLVSTSGLLATTDQLLLPPELIHPGGYLGNLIWRYSGPLLGTPGSVLLLLLMLIFSLMAAVRFSPLGTVQRFWKMLAGLKDLVKKIPGRSVENRKKPKSRRQEPEMTASPAPAVKKIESMPAVHEPAVMEEFAAGEGEPFVLRPQKTGNYRLPSLSLLDRHDQQDIGVDKDHYYKVSSILISKLEDFAVSGEVTGISPGPVVTTYEYAPAPGVKINKIVSLADDLAMALKVDRVRIVGSIPGKAALGIEIPNPTRKTVYLRDILVTEKYRDSKSRLSLALGLDVVGRPVIADITKMPHLLIAGATGAGKSVAINAFIASILFKATPDEVRLLMVDPKRIELSAYENIPHLLHPVVVEPKMASRALIWAVKEMERRYRLLEEYRVKSFDSFNQLADVEKLPYIVIIVDELADLMMVASKDVESSIARLAQMARAAGMHIILATQRPSVDVLTGLIKANFPTRISFKVSSKVDSRTILDQSGAEHLLGDGDMLFLPPGAAKLRRIHGAFISEAETERMIAFIKQQGHAEYDESVLQVVEEEPAVENGELDAYDDRYDEAVAVVTETGQASISMVQRRLRVGYNRAARMIEVMEREGIIGPSDGSRPREVLVRPDYSE